MHVHSRRALLSALAALPVLPLSSANAQEPRFRWPQGKRGAVSLSFDDARVSQVDTGIPLLNRLGMKATFYVSPNGFRQRVQGWKRALADGHEMGHHSNSHPCSGNFRFSRNNALEDYTVSRLEADFDAASKEIAETFGVQPVSFAYPCGQTFVGRGEQQQSYVPVIARRFRTGRGYLNEAPNDPFRCDPAYLMGTGCDNLHADALLALIEAAMHGGRWLIFAGHDFGDPARQTTSLDALEAVARFVNKSANGVWLDTVDTVSAWLLAERKKHL